MLQLQFADYRILTRSLEAEVRAASWPPERPTSARHGETRCVIIVESRADNPYSTVYIIMSNYITGECIRGTHHRIRMATHVMAHAR